MGQGNFVLRCESLQNSRFSFDPTNYYRPMEEVTAATTTTKKREKPGEFSEYLHHSRDFLAYKLSLRCDVMSSPLWVASKI